MIFIEKNAINRITMDIAQYEYYLLEFTNSNTCGSNTAIFSNSSFNCSYPVFSIEEVCEADEDVLDGKINLNYIGYWTVNIYGNPDDTNLDPNLAVLLNEEDSRVYINGCDTCKSC